MVALFPYSGGFDQSQPGDVLCQFRIFFGDVLEVFTCQSGVLNGQGLSACAFSHDNRIKNGPVLALRARREA